MKLSSAVAICGLLTLGLGAPALAQQSQCFGFDDMGYPNLAPEPARVNSSIETAKYSGAYILDEDDFTSYKHTKLVEWDGSEGFYNNYNFASSNLSDSTFKSSDLTGAFFGCTRLHRVNFTNADLTRANFEGADIEGADFTGATLDFAYWIDGRRCAPGSVGRCNQL